MRPGDAEVLEARIAAFEQQHPRVRVRSLYKETEELRSGLESAVLVGRGPDVVFGPSDVIGVYHTIGALRDLAEFFTAEELADFDPRAVVSLPAKESPDRDNLLMLGDRFGNHLALVYDRRRVPSAPKSTDELVALAEANTIDADSDGRPERYGLVWNYREPFFAVPFLTGYGAWVFADKREDGRPVPTLDTPESVAAYRFVSGLREKGLLPRSADYEGAASLFLEGKVAMLIDGDWSWQKYASAPGIDAAVAPLPVVSETGLPMAPMVAPRGYSLTVASAGAGRDAGVDLIRFLINEDSQRIALEEQRTVPSRLSVRAEARELNDPILTASLAQLEVGRLMPTDVELRVIWDSMRPHYQSLMAGRMTPEQAAAAMQAEAVSNIQRLLVPVAKDWSALPVKVMGVASLAALAIAAVWVAVRVTRDFSRNRLAYLFVAPSVALIFATVLFPLAYNIVLSFSNMSLSRFHDWEVVGVGNYADIFFGRQSGAFWGVLGKTIAWTVINVFFHVTLGVMLALALNGPIRGKPIYRLLLVIPWAVPAYITALTWRGMFDAEFGSASQLATAVNRWLPGFLQLPEVWLTEPGPAFAACIIANVWLGFPFMMIVALGGLQGIPQELYEAATIDRASRWQQFWNITVPMLRPVMLPAVTLGAVWTFNNLNIVWLVSNGGEPSDKTHILVSYVYKAVFNLYQYGYGAALSMVIFGMLLGFSMLFLSRTRATEGVT
ncbi:Maltose transport system permease protein MalF [Pirellulimonas nuda]|uniref:Maltose transport system permease protein MalF n=1 Tax=Pirellulimonas nuda TaxID=2528009 RepID=A0A518DFI2_9BACT|nr:extracellular solute-binding protein [Pirellulimonas nuda]QDU90237.1 Maltose transport system permease protein MalF [Pirellulimonas nuda]